MTNKQQDFQELQQLYQDKKKLSKKIKEREREEYFNQIPLYCLFRTKEPLINNQRTWTWMQYNKSKYINPWDDYFYCIKKEQQQIYILPLEYNEKRILGNIESLSFNLYNDFNLNATIEVLKLPYVIHFRKLYINRVNGKYFEFKDVF